MSLSSTPAAGSELAPPPRVAVALAAYNGMEFIAAQIDSILKQAGVTVRVFVSVDKSSDGTEQWVEHLTKREPRVVLLETGQVFGGASANFFRLLREMCLDEFDYFAFADQDDIWELEKLHRAHMQMRLHAVSAYSSNVTAFWPSGRRHVINKAQPQRQWDHLFEAAGPGCTYVLKHELACELQSVARSKGELLTRLTFHDWFCYAYARSHGYAWHIDDYSGLMYRQHSANQFGANAGWLPMVRRMKQVWSGEAFGQLRLMVDAIGLPATHPVRFMLTGGALGLIKLALLSYRCRRKTSEQFVFCVSCLIGAARSMSCRPR